MKKQISLIILGLFLTNMLWACTFTSSSFCVDTGHLSYHSVISGEIISIDEDGIDVAVMDVLKGDETNAVIRIWDGTDFDCNGMWPMAASDLGQVGDVKILVLPKIVEIENTWDVIGDYRRPNWYEYTTDLNVVDGIVMGWIKGYSYWDQNDEIQYTADYIGELAYDAFVSSFSETIDCSTMVDVEKITENLQIGIQNPFQSELKITIGNENFNGTIAVFDVNGIAVKQLAVQSQNQVAIDFSFVPSGIYFVRFEDTEYQSMVRKVIKL